MEKYFIKGAKLASALLLITLSATAQFNKNATLKIGDTAPALKVEAFVRGKPITKFEKGKVYVVDFWATWCGGCIASFPHISYLANNYKNRVHFISVDSYEDAGEHKGEDPAQVVKAFLKTPIGQPLTLDVCVDGPNNAMYTNWVKPLRRNGFPTTFIIDQDGKLAWMDVNLDNLEWVLQLVVAKKWDLNKAAAVMKGRDDVEDILFLKALREKGEQQKKSYQEVLKASEAFEGRFPDRKASVAFYKFMALTELDKPQVPAILEQMAADPLSKYINLDDANGLTLRRNDLNKRDYEALVKVQERLLTNKHNGTGHGGKSVKAYENLADTYWKAGQGPQAVATQEKAIAMAKVENATGQKLDSLLRTLNRYKG
jgi:thiol-disulfide isomerase/thioredoxin